MFGQENAQFQIPTMINGEKMAKTAHEVAGLYYARQQSGRLATSQNCLTGVAPLLLSTAESGRILACQCDQLGLGGVV